MTRQSKAAAPAAAFSYEPDAHYEVTLSRIVKDEVHTGLTFSPAKHNVLKGKVCEAIKDAITDARKL